MPHLWLTLFRGLDKLCLSRYSLSKKKFIKPTVPLLLVPQSPPNFLHAASLAKHVKPVVVIPDEDEPEPQDDEDDEPEPLIDVSDTPASSVQAQPQVGRGSTAVWWMNNEMFKLSNLLFYFVFFKYYVWFVALNGTCKVIWPCGLKEVFRVQWIHCLHPCIGLVGAPCVVTE